MNRVGVSKRCSKCGVEKELEEFNKHRRSKDNHYSQCRSCKREGGRRWYHLHKERAKRWATRWRKANPKKAETACNLWRIKNREHDLKRCREYSEINVINLTDIYVKRTIVRDSDRKNSEVSQLEVDIKREQLMLHRALHELKRAVNGSN